MLNIILKMIIVVFKSARGIIHVVDWLKVTWSSTTPLKSAAKSISGGWKIAHVEEILEGCNFTPGETYSARCSSMCGN